MRPDTTSSTEAEAADAARIAGRDEDIGGRVDSQAPAPWFAKGLGPDPWLPYPCPKCGDVDPAGMPEVCGLCNWRNYGFEVVKKP